MSQNQLETQFIALANGNHICFSLLRASRLVIEGNIPL